MGCSGGGIIPSKRPLGSAQLTRRKDYVAIYSIMNEWSQIVGQWAVGNTSFDEYATGMRDVLKRYDDLGY
jgi:hypothetical protein